MRKNILMTLVIVVGVILSILAVSILYDSKLILVRVTEDVEEVKEVELFMIKVDKIEFFEGNYDVCIFLSKAILFEDIGITFDYVHTMCYYNDYLIFESQGIIYITNGTYTVIDGETIDNITKLGGELR